MDKKVRVRFAPSPTGGLHIGGVRTVLYNYLFARQHHGDFILRIEDTDQNRYVAGAEEYILSCLKWTGLVPDESVETPGNYGPYRQSERKDLYKEYALQLIDKGTAYYAFDTPQELEHMRHTFKTEQNPTPQYDHTVRMHMRNSLTLTEQEVLQLIDAGTPYVIRIKMPNDETIAFTDMIRGQVSFNSSLVDDKVLLKADGMPTYHLAVVVDDYLMKITHAFRGEEWLPSSPVHIYVWQQLFGLDNMPQWAHFPLILGPNGKLSKRDGAAYGFPVFAQNWKDPTTGETTAGYKETGFLPQAFINFLALLGWNDGTEQEIFTIEELITRFTIDRVHVAGARFDYEKAKWFNHEWIKRLPATDLIPYVIPILQVHNIEVKDTIQLEKIITLVKDRCVLLTDFYEQAAYFFSAPTAYDEGAVLPKWNDFKRQFFTELMSNFNSTTSWEHDVIEANFQNTAIANQLKNGDVMLPFRIMLVGGKFGPGVYDIAALLGKEETVKRIQLFLTHLQSK